MIRVWNTEKDLPIESNSCPCAEYVHTAMLHRYQFSLCHVTRNWKLLRPHPRQKITIDYIVKFVLINKQKILKPNYLTMRRQQRDFRWLPGEQDVRCLLRTPQQPAMKDIYFSLRNQNSQGIKCQVSSYTHLQSLKSQASLSNLYYLN